MTDRVLSLALQLERLAPGAEPSDSLEIPCSFASDRIIEDPWIGPVQLAMDPTAVDLSRAAAGIPVRVMHERGLPLARVMDVALDGGTLRGTLRFSQSQQGRDLCRDCQDGIITDLSVGAEIHAVREETGYLVATRWTPREVSLVDVGADPGVGINRAQPLAAPAAPIEDPSMSDHQTTGAATSNAPDPGQSAASILRLAEYAHQRAPELDLMRLGQDYAEFGKPFEEFREKVWTALAERQAQQPTPSPKADLGMSQQEANQFSIIRATRAYLSKDWRKAGFEMEASRAVAERLGRDPKGFYVPAEVQRTLSAGSATAGGFLVGNQHRADLFIDALRASSIAMAAGVRVISGLRDNVSIPKKTSTGTFYWLSESEDVTLSDAAFGAVNMTPRTVAGAIAMTRRLLAQSTPDVELLVRQDLVTGAALAIDKAVFEGSGSKEPLGIVNVSGINTQAVSTDTTPTWAEMVGFESEVATDNALTGSLKYITTPAVRGSLKTTAKFSNTGTPIMDGNSVNGYDLLTSTQLATSRLIFGDWSQIILGMWGVLDIKPDEAALAASGGLVLRVFQDVDMVCRQPTAFCLGT